MSCSLWRYTEQCEGRPCPGDCDYCDFDPDEVTITPPTVDYGTRPHPWLPESVHGEKPTCRNCERFKDGCGRLGFICGDWEEAEEVQMMI